MCIFAKVFVCALVAEKPTWDSGSTAAIPTLFLLDADEFLKWMSGTSTPTSKGLWALLSLAEFFSLVRRLVINC